MFNALSKAFGQSADPAFRRVFVFSFLISLAIFVVLWVVAGFALSWLGEGLGAWVTENMPFEWIRTASEWLFSTLSVTAVLIVSFFLFPSVMLIGMSFLLDPIAEAVEREHYPGLPAARYQPNGEAIRGALVFTAVTLVINLIALPFYLALLFLPPMNLVLFYLINGYLLGREYFELVAVRRLDIRGATKLRKHFRLRIILAGAVIAFLLTIPILNLFMPILATAFMLHIFEELRRRTGGATS
ncbi:EI24 domain-containing protein [Pelagibius sp. Alg239-R121]|uniref:EI24 domain-containing protein n=1 Tax=Pelagibius sp. Alg239-R121 TaxID=2993448 RepID=UPI0024A72FEC|nr:EI24 domain-containing protein [Pelagibius sp. Alg239-R121]